MFFTWRLEVASWKLDEISEELIVNGEELRKACCASLQQVKAVNSEGNYLYEKDYNTDTFS